VNWRGHRSKTGDIRALPSVVVSEKVASKHDQISVFDARRNSNPTPSSAMKSRVEVPRPTRGAIASQNAKQALSNTSAAPEKN